MMKFPSLLLVLSIFLATLSSCSRTSDFTLLSTKNVMLGLDKSQFRGTFQAEDSKSIYFVIPTGIPNMKEAADKVLERGGGNILLNAVVYQKTWYVPLIYGEVSYIIKGDVYLVEESTINSLKTNTGTREVR